MTELEILAAVRKVAEALDRLAIGYYIGGSVASSLYGVPRTTNDADLIAAVAAGHARPLTEALAADFYVDEDMILDAVAREGMFNVVHNDTAMKVDVYILKSSAWDREAFARRRLDSLEDPPASVNYPFGSAEDILLHKLVWFRSGGEVSERQWKDVLGVLRVQRQTLDIAYLDRWAPILGVADLLARARSEAA